MFRSSNTYITGFDQTRGKMNEKTEKPVEPETPLDANEIVDARELSAAELEAINEAENASENLSLEAMKPAFATVLGGIAGFTGVGFLNNWLMQTIAANDTNTGSALMNDLVLYSGVIFAAEFIVGSLFTYWGAKKGGLFGHFFLGIGVGFVTAGFGTFLTEILASQGQSGTIALPAAVSTPGGPSAMRLNQAIAV
jgi:hypothetical protein